LKNYLGIKYGRLTVIGEAEPTKVYANGRRDRRLLCRCECGIEKVVTRNLLLSGHSKSCGCLATDLLTTHGMSHTRTYRVWWGMMVRHRGQDNVKNYKARGIQVCKRWHKFENFLKDMGERPETDGLPMTIERKDNSKGYSPSNCVWATMMTQARNKRNNHVINYQGREWCITDLAKEFGMSIVTLGYRLKHWGSLERALTTPVRQRKTPSSNTC